uniref:Gustatory receptor n=1 Tax=Tetranychus urticae TaxID=32264 RepID=T1JYD4_TETUR
MKLGASFRFITKTVYHAFLGIPQLNEHHDSTIYALDRFERYTIFFCTLRNGFRQYEVQPRQVSQSTFLRRFFGARNWSIRLASALNFFRFLSLIFIEEESTRIYLGDNVFRSKDRNSICVLILSSIVVSIFSREWFLHIEAGHKCTVLNNYDWIRNKGLFDNVYLKMTVNQAKQFRITVHFLLNLYNRIIVVLVPFITILYNLPFLTNPYTYRIPLLAFYGSLWSLTLTWSVVFLANEIFTISGYLFFICAVHYHRIESIIEQCNSKPNSIYSTRREYSSIYLDKSIISWASLCTSTWTDRINQFEFDFDRLRYLVLYYFTVVAFLGDLFIFLGLVVGAHSKLVANMIAMLGGLILVLCVIACYFTGGFVTKLQLCHRKFHSICCSTKLPILNSLKILEIMDRSLGPRVGIKVGDLTTITQMFFISFILEVGSTLMLFVCNVRGLFASN